MGDAVMLWKKQTVSNVSKFRSLVLLGTGRIIIGPGEFEAAFPWRGKVSKIQVNAKNPGETDTSFYIEYQSKEDYTAQLDNWQPVIEEPFVLPADVVYVEIPATADVSPGDVFRLNFINGDAANLVVQVIIKLESDI